MNPPPEVTSALEDALTAAGFLAGGLALLAAAIAANLFGKSDDE